MERVSLWQLVGYFLRLGAFGFGGPIALAGSMQRDLIPKGWITEQEYIEGLAFSQTMPGPLAAQLAMWIGYIRHGAIGASLVGIVFVLPAFLIVLLISALYVAYNGLPVVQALFYGIGPMVIAIIARSAFRLARTTVGSDYRLWIIFAIVAAITLFARAETALLFVLAGLAGIFLHFRPGHGKTSGSILPSSIALFTGAGAAAKSSVFVALGGFFVKAGAFTFGSGLAIVPFLHQGVVMEHHWLTERQFLDAVAVGIITPGPVVITAAFVGYIVAGFWGAVIASAGVFLPVYLFVLLIGRYIIRYRSHPALIGFVKGATAAATGAIAGATLILGQGSITDLPTALICAAGLLILGRFNLPEQLLVIASGLTGLMLS